MKTLKMTILGKPIPLERPFFNRKGIAFDRKRSKDEKARIGMEMLSYRGSWGISDKTLGVSLVFCGANPRADIDNLIKQVLDAGNGVLWKDDFLIDTISAHKVKSDNPRIEIEIWEKQDAQTRS